MLCNLLGCRGVCQSCMPLGETVANRPTHTHTLLIGRLTETKIWAIYWAYSMSKISQSLCPPPQSWFAHSLILSSSEFATKSNTEISLNHVCVAAAVGSSPPCSICHSFGVKDKQTDENDSNHRISSSVPASSVPRWLPLSKVTNMHFHPTLYCMYVSAANETYVCTAHGPHFKLQLHLHNWILLCLNTRSVLPWPCHQSASHPIEDSDVWAYF